MQNQTIINRKKMERQVLIKLMKSRKFIINFTFNILNPDFHLIPWKVKRSMGRSVGDTSKSLQAEISDMACIGRNMCNPSETSFSILKQTLIDGVYRKAVKKKKNMRKQDKEISSNKLICRKIFYDILPDLF